MTAQIGDIYRYEGEEYTCLRVRGEKLFEPAEYGMRPVRMHTACQRGFYCEYEITPSGLQLRTLHIKLSDDDYPPLNGVNVSEPEYVKAEEIDEEGNVTETVVLRYVGHRVYEDLGLFQDFTGKILLGADFDGAYYIHMGLQRPYGYRKLLSLEFGHGRLKEVLDFSETAERIRDVCEMSDVFFTMMPSSTEAKEAAIPPDVKEKIWWHW